jgi:hypothetical protein
MVNENATKLDAPVVVELAGREAELRAKVKSDRTAGYFVSALTVAVGVVNVVLFVGKTSTWPQVTGWVVFALFTLMTIGFFSTMGDRNVELQKLEAQRLVLRQLAGTPPDTANMAGAATTARDEDYFRNLVTINVTNLREYYFLVKTHTHASFRTALVVGVIGFGLVVAGVAIGYAGNNQTFGLVSAAAGIITEFIASVFFYLYNRTVRQLKEYHDSLLDVQDVLLALKVLEGLQDPATKSEVVKSVVTYLMEGSRKLRATTIGTTAAADA